MENEIKTYGLVYLLFNTISQKWYVGQTKSTLDIRWKGHIHGSKNIEDKRYILCSIRKYGPESFTREVIGYAYSKEELDNLEDLWILILNALDPEYGYNLMIGKKVSQESRDRARKKITGKNHPGYRHDIGNKEILDLYDDGIMIADIARKFDASIETILDRLKSLGISPVRPLYRENFEELEDLVCQEYESGSNLKQIKIKFGLDARITKRILNSKKVKIRKKSKFLPIDIIILEYLAGEHTVSLGKKYQVDPSTIGVKLKEAGITLRSTRKSQILSNVKQSASLGGWTTQ